MASRTASAGLRGLVRFLSGRLLSIPNPRRQIDSNSTIRRMFEGRQLKNLLRCIKEPGDGDATSDKIDSDQPMTTNTLSTITCPSCAHQATEMMPTDTLQSSYQCKGCGTVLRPKAGHDCVFCSYGDIPCPSIQAERAASAKAGTCCGGCGG